MTDLEWEGALSGSSWEVDSSGGEDATQDVMLLLGDSLSIDPLLGMASVVVEREIGISEGGWLEPIPAQESLVGFIRVA